jgi:predicted TIM-barrel fold metal-dependent hydrolase
MHRGDAEGLLEINSHVGVRRTALVSWVGPLGSEPVEGNDIVARAVAAHPDRFLGVVYINPTHLSEEALTAELRRRVEEQGFVAAKPYPRAGLKYSDPLYTACWQYVDRLGLYVLLHLGDGAGGVDTVAELAAEFSNAQWVIAHSGGSFAFAREVTAGMKAHQNIWAELTLTPVTNNVIEWMVSEVGDDRILFGTDAPMRDPRPQLGWVVWSDLPLESRLRILGGNYERLLGMRRSDGQANG